MNLRRFTYFLILPAVSATLVSCVNKGVKIAPAPNPMELIWEGIRGKIVYLEESHATLAEWREAGPQEQRLNDVDEARYSLEGTGLAPEDIDQALARLPRATKTIHFGFDCDYHALVFFDKTDRASSVIKW